MNLAIPGSAEACPVCVTLPSARAASDMLQGKPLGIPGVIGSTLFRGGLVALGLYAVGARKHLWRNALAGAVAVEMFVILWAAAAVAKQKKS